MTPLRVLQSWEPSRYHRPPETLFKNLPRSRKGSSIQRGTTTWGLTPPRLASHRAQEAPQ